MVSLINFKKDLFIFKKYHHQTAVLEMFIVNLNSGPLLELDESQHSERTVFIPPPEAGSNKKPLIYKTFKLNPELMRPQKNLSLKNPALTAFSMVPGSPMARRTKHEIKVAQKMARKQVGYHTLTRSSKLEKFNLQSIKVMNLKIITQLIYQSVNRQLYQKDGPGVCWELAIVYGSYICLLCCKCRVNLRLFYTKPTSCLSKCKNYAWIQPRR